MDLLGSKRRIAALTAAVALIAGVVVTAVVVSNGRSATRPSTPAAVVVSVPSDDATNATPRMVPYSSVSASSTSNAPSTSRSPRHRHGGNPSPSRAPAAQQSPPVGDNLETGSGVAAPAPPIREIVLPPVREVDDDVDGDEESSGDESGREDEERRKGEQR